MLDFQTISGKSAIYRIERELGHGAQGKTYLVTRESDQQQLVLKWLEMASVEKWKVIDRFKREGEILKSISFPGIPKYIELIEHEQGLGIVQDYINGTTWQKLIDQQMPVHIDQAETQLAGLLQILNYLTTFHPPIIHRDISPKNIMVDQQGEIYLIDFGSVQAALHQQSKTVTTMGTFGYMAPEQVMGQAVPQSDLFSLGVSFVARLTNRDPDDFILDADYGGIDLKKMGLELPPYLMQVIQKMITPGLDQRFKAPREALDQLQQREMIAPVVATPVKTTVKTVSRVKSSKKWHRKWRYRLGIVVVLIFFGGYIASRIPAEGEITTYGGWFSGHGDLIPSITSTLFGDAALINYPNAVDEVAFSPDGKLIASLADRGVIVRQKDGGKIIFRDDQYNGGYLHFYKNSELWIYNHRGNLEMIDLKTKKRSRVTSGENWLLKKEGVTAKIECKRGIVHRGEEIWLFCYYDQGYGKKVNTMVELRGGEIIKDVQMNPANYSIYPVADGVITLENNYWIYLKRWDFNFQKIGEKRLNIKGENSGIRMKTDGKLFLIGMDSRFFVVADGKLRCSFRVSGYGYTRIALHAKREIGAVVKRSKIHIYDLKTCQQRQVFSGHRRFTEGFTFSPDGKELLSGGYDQTVKLWDVK